MNGFWLTVSVMLACFIGWRLRRSLKISSSTLDLQEMLKDIDVEEAIAGFDLALVGLAGAYSAEMPSHKPYHPYAYIVMAVALHSHALTLWGGPFSSTDRNKLRLRLAAATKTLKPGDTMGNIRKLQTAVQDYRIDENPTSEVLNSISSKLLEAYRFANSRCV